MESLPDSELATEALKHQQCQAGDTERYATELDLIDFGFSFR
jgi:hypothetical protein